MIENENAIIHQEIKTTNFDIDQINKRTLNWLRENQFKILENNGESIIAKQRILDSGEGLHPRYWYKNMEFYFDTTNDEYIITLFIKSPIILNISEKKKAKLFWSEYVKSYLEYLDIDYSKNILLGLFQHDYYSERMKNENKLLLGCTIFNIVVMWELLSSIDFIIKILLILLIESSIIIIINRRKKAIKKERTELF